MLVMQQNLCYSCSFDSKSIRLLQQCKSGGEQRTLQSRQIDCCMCACAAILTLVPDDNPALTAVKYLAAAVLLGSTGAFLAGAFLLSSLSDD